MELISALSLGLQTEIDCYITFSIRQQRKLILLFPVTLLFVMLTGIFMATGWLTGNMRLDGLRKTLVSTSNRSNCRHSQVIPIVYGLFWLLTMRTAS